MTTRISTGVRNLLAQSMGFGAIFNKGTINIYSGAQPATADSAVAGTLLGVVSLNSSMVTQETQAAGTVTITGGATSVTAVTVGTFNIIPDGPVPYNTSASQTAADLCDAINRNGIYTASVAGAVVTIKPRPGAGAAHNGYVVTSTGSVTATYANMSGGIAAASALVLGVPAAGVIAKPPSAIWGFTGIATGTAGWFRLIGSVADAGGAIVAAPYLPRLDGSIATSGADLNLSNIAITTGSPNTIDSFTFQIPAQ